MTTNANQLEQYRHRLASVLRDLQTTAAEDGEAVAMIGSLAAQLADKVQRQKWSEAKDVMSPANRAELLRSFETRGNTMHQAGQTKQAYAIQALAISLLAGTMRQDRNIAEGEGLLDALIDRAVVLYRRHLASLN